MNKYYSYYAIFIGAVCVYFLTRTALFPQNMLLRNAIIQGALIGFGLAFVSAQIYARIIARKVNGWITVYGLGDPENGMFLRAAHAQLFPGPVNTAEEAMYWWTHADGAGHALTGANEYVMHFPAGGLPPNEAFWSITMGDAKNQYVANPLNRYSISDRTGLIPNHDGSVDIHIRKEAPAGKESNWLPAPSGNFILWLRVYIPGEDILKGKYTVPPVLKVSR
ncbi:MAG: DUF1214 domain-containing protein [Anaerolineaceae bacterium]|nr:DUF1214 domain-containing protein [Anaerolineaceae bacterium]